MLTCLINIILISLLGNCVYADWGYRFDDPSKTAIEVPSQWSAAFPLCAGFKQSPINVDFATTVYDSTLSTLTVVQTASSTAETWTIENNGHSLSLTSTKAYTFSSLNGVVFNMLGFHLHWRGSEHEVNGRKYAGEIHLVHQSSVNSTQLSVIGFLLVLSINDNPKLTPILDTIKNIRDYKATTTSTAFTLESLVQMSFTSYYRYEGSLTTPTCDERVQWILVDSPMIAISENQLLELQSLREKTTLDILTNARPVQSLNGRVVSRSFSPTVSGSSLSASGIAASHAPAGISQAISATVFASPLIWMLTAYLIN